MSEPLLDEAKKSLEKFIIATNDLDDSRLSGEAMLTHYTAQGISSNGVFGFSKIPCSLPIACS
ncbi:MAG: hypothetical protein MUO76_04265 [Anaerolineaceae bacterium]|nr:hypothetical protein [Anaerolineaceae bacterium]